MDSQMKDIIQHMKENRIRYLGWFLASFLFFLAAKAIPLTMYLGTVSIAMLALLLMYCNPKNASFLWGSAAYISMNIAAYISERFLAENVMEWSISQRGLSFNIAFFAFALLYLILIFTAFLFGFVDHNEKVKKSYDFTKTDIPVSDWFIKPRKYDLFRLEEYLSRNYIVGVNGKWGAGKTCLSEELYKRHEGSIYMINLDVLTCNENELDIFLINELRKLLAKNRIYSGNAQIVENLMSDHSVLKEIRSLFADDAKLKTKVFEAYKEDIRKLDKVVVIAVEDLDRIREGKTIRRLLDFTERLSCDHIRIIFEYDADKLNELEIDRKYLEKYIPFVINLTPISFPDTIRYYEKEIGILPEDFNFLIYERPLEGYVAKHLGINASFHMKHRDTSLRRVKHFLLEVRQNMERDYFKEKKNKETLIAFFYMKHFLPEVYEGLDFFQDCLHEMKFALPENDKKEYSFQELMNVARGKENDERNSDLDLTKERLKDLFFGNDDVQIRNREKLMILILLGYNFQYMDEDYLREQEIKKIQNINVSLQKRYDRLYTLKKRELDRAYHNDKISRLIRNLYANGLSENTDEEENARVFIDSVLYAQAQKKAWIEYGNIAHYSNYEKDNTTIFKLMGDSDVELAKALSIYLERHRKSYDIEDVWMRFLAFRYETFCTNEDAGITPEYVSFCYYVYIEKRKVFISQIKRFCKMRIVGNLKREKLYKVFLEKYLQRAYMYGYINWFDGERVQFMDEEDTSFMVDYLGELAEQSEKMADETVMKNDAEEDMKAVAAFIRKNIEILQFDKNAKRRMPRVSVKTHVENHYQNEDTYHELEELAGTGVSEEEYIKRLNKEYGADRVSVMEMRMLYDLYCSKMDKKDQ